MSRSLLRAPWWSVTVQYSLFLNSMEKDAGRPDWQLNPAHSVAYSQKPQHTSV